ncbi:MAG: FAD:protein FMN transferase [Gemmatimonadales bacterium]
MGTRFEIVLPGGDGPRLRAAAEAAVEAIEECHRRFTRFEASSLLSHLRRIAPAGVALDPEDAEIFAAAAAIREASAGAFDVSLGHAAGGFRLDRAAGVVALAEDAALDFGAIAKGFAVDRAVARLQDAGIRTALVHGGTSSIRTIGRPLDLASWRVALPNGPAIELTDAALAVSATSAGSRMGAVDPAASGPAGEGDRWHVADPRTGALLRSDRRVAVRGPNAGWADGWATAVLVTGARPAAMGREWDIWFEEAGQWATIA